jgi:hypothetical protein
MAFLPSFHPSLYLIRPPSNLQLQPISYAMLLPLALFCLVS